VSATDRYKICDGVAVDGDAQALACFDAAQEVGSVVSQLTLCYNVAVICGGLVSRSAPRGPCSAGARLNAVSGLGCYRGPWLLRTPLLGVGCPRVQDYACAARGADGDAAAACDLGAAGGGF
jgi:hypothetical protein